MKRFIIVSAVFRRSACRSGICWCLRESLVARACAVDPLSVGEYLESAAGDGTLLQASLVTMRRLAGWLRHRHCGRLAARAADGALQVLRRYSRRARAWLADAAERLLGAAGAALVRANGSSDAFCRHHGHALVGDHRDRQRRSQRATDLSPAPRGRWARSGCTPGSKSSCRRRCHSSSAG